MNTALASFSSDRWWIALIFFLMSAFVVAEQDSTNLSYDDLVNNSIYSTSGKWRGKTIAADDEWRIPKSDSKSLGPNAEDETSKARWDEEPVTQPVEDTNSSQGYRLFKIDL